jgi:hypothetical protein
MEGKKSYFTEKMYETSRMEQYMRQFRNCMQDADYINKLIQNHDPKFSHSMEMIYQWCVYDVYDQMEQHIHHQDGNPMKKRIDIQIEIFHVFVRSFLTDIYNQLSTSKPFYFHNLTHQEQRQRSNAVITPLLSKMVHPTPQVVTANVQNPVSAQTDAVVQQLPVRVISASKVPNPPPIRSSQHSITSRVVHVDEHAPLDDGDEVVDDEVEASSHTDRVSAASSAKISTSDIVPSASSIQSAKFASAVVLPEPIRSAKPDLTKPIKDLIVNVAPKPKTPPPVKLLSQHKIASAVKPSLESKIEIKSARKQIITPMKLHSDAIHQKAAKVQSSARIASSSKISGMPMVKSAKVQSVKVQ